MKKVLFILLCIPFFASAQLPGVPGLSGKNIFKVNLSSLAFRNFNFTYERKLTGRVSASLGYRFMSKGSPPFQSTLENVIESSDINFSNFKIGGNAITPEVRLYVGKGNLTGFYIAPYLRFASFDITAPVEYESTTFTLPSTFTTVTKDADLVGNIKSTSGGLMIGMQRRLFKVLVIDIWIIGGHYGSSKGNLNFSTTPPLTTQEQASLKDNLDGIDASPFKFTNTVNANGAILKSDGPWAGVRGLGINVGIRF